MRKLNSQEITNVNGGFLPLLAVALYAPTSFTIGGITSAMAVGAGAGAIVGGITAILSD